MHEYAMRIWEFLRIVAKRFIDDRLTYSASALTFTTLLALVPLVAIIIAILSAFPVFHLVSAQIKQFIFQNFIPASGAVVQQYLQDFVRQAGKLSVFGTIFLVATSVMMILTIERALNNVWKIKERRRGVAAFLRYWAVLSLAPIFITLSFAATTYVMSLPIVAGTVSSLGIKKVLVASVPTFLTLCAFTFLYVVVPNCKVPFRHGFYGAIVATVFFEVAKKIFVMYVKHIPTYRLIYGAMAAVPIFLVWLYLIWVIILFGALVSNILATNYFEKRAGKIDAFSHAFLWLGYLWKSQQQGETLTLNKLFRLLPGYYSIESNEQLRQLREAKLIETTHKNTYVLTRDFSKMTLSDLYQVLPWKLPTVEENHLFSDKIKKIFHNANQSISDHLDVPLSELYQEL